MRKLSSLIGFAAILLLLANSQCDANLDDAIDCDAFARAACQAAQRCGQTSSSFALSDCVNAVGARCGQVSNGAHLASQCAGDLAAAVCCNDGQPNSMKSVCGDTLSCGASASSTDYCQIVEQNFACSGSTGSVSGDGGTSSNDGSSSDTCSPPAGVYSAHFGNPNDSSCASLPDISYSLSAGLFSNGFDAGSSTCTSVTNENGCTLTVYCDEGSTTSSETLTFSGSFASGTFVSTTVTGSSSKSCRYTVTLSLF